MDGPLARARAALARGDVLIAYDEATAASEADPADLDARFLAALALARAGAAERAREAAADLSARLAAGAGAPPALQEDAAALVARLAKDRALAADAPARDALLREAAELYEAVANRFDSAYSCINAATLRLLAGDVDHARDLAVGTRKLLGDSVADSWRDATEAEAALILGELDAARAALARVVSSGGDLAARAVTRRQLRLVCDATGADPSVLDDLAPPLVLHYCGHRVDPVDEPGRFPPELESRVVREIHEFLAANRVGFAYGSLASGADILIAEAVLALGIELHVVLPFDTDEFERTSVVPAGPGWTARFRSCLTRASSITFGSDSAYLGDDELYGYAACIAMGHALNRARNLDATAVQLAVYDGSGAPGVAGTAHDVAVWAAAGHETQVIGLSTPAATASQVASTGRETIRAIGSILFTDFRGFSRLRDEHFPVFIENVYTEFGAILDGHKDAVLWRNAWGDATAVVFSTATAAADCALAFQETVARLDFAALGLPADLDLRIGGHAGPVLAIGDPISGRPTYWGRELTRAARIEPRTPGGAIYVTDAFAALLALQPDAPFVTEYVGRIMTAKDFERIPMYRLRRR